MFEYKKIIYFIGFSNECCDIAKNIVPDNIELIFSENTHNEYIKKADFIVANLSDNSYNDLITKMHIYNKSSSILVICLSRENFQKYNISNFLDIWYDNPMPNEIKAYIEKLLCDIERIRLLFEYKEVIDTMVDTTDDMIWVKDINGSHRFFNQSFLDALPASKDGHRKTKDECLNRGHLFLWELSPIDYKEGEFICMESEYDVIKANKTLLFEETLKVSSGELRNLITRKSPVHDENGNIIGTIGVAKDITQELRYKKQLEKNAYTDALTGLYNRRYIYKFIKDNAHKPFALLFMDLNNFKYINDNYGHIKGDEALKLTTNLLIENLQNFTIGRTGGDEFIAIGPCVDNLSILTSKVKNIIEDTYKKNECLTELGISIGFSINEPTKTDIEELIHEADNNMYRQKMMSKAE